MRSGRSRQLRALDIAVVGPSDVICRGGDVSQLSLSFALRVSPSPVGRVPSPKRGEHQLPFWLWSCAFVATSRAPVSRQSSTGMALAAFRLGRGHFLRRRREYNCARRTCRRVRGSRGRTCDTHGLGSRGIAQLPRCGDAAQAGCGGGRREPSSARGRAARPRRREAAARISMLGEGSARMRAADNADKAAARRRRQEAQGRCVRAATSPEEYIASRQCSSACSASGCSNAASS